MKTIMCDVDNTLVFSAAEFPGYAHDALPFIMIEDRKFFINTTIVNLMLDFHARGHTVYIWSAGGEVWAQTVATVLGLLPYVKGCLSKPDWLFDDKPYTDWMPEVEYLYPPVRQDDIVTLSVQDAMSIVNKHTWGNYNQSIGNIVDDLKIRSKKYDRP